jgi:hypothetical protein
MASRVPDEFESGIGDVTEVMSNQGVPDLSWLNVDEEDYRALEALPRQNLDMIPELQSALSWDGKDPRVPEINPMRPHTMVNRNPLDRPGATLRSNSSVTNRLAAYVVAGLPDQVIAARLRSEFSPEQLSASHAEAAEILAEKGLLGNVYVDAKYFPRCAQEGPHRDFVAKTAKRALFVLAKEACGGCVCNKSGSCSSFKKRLTTEVPYDRKTAASYLPQLASENRLVPGAVQAVVASGSTPDTIRMVLRNAFLRPVASSPPEAPQTIQHRSIPKARPVTEADVVAFRDRQAAEESDPMPGPMARVVSKRMMQGRYDVSSIVASSDAEVRGLAQEHGLLGHTYLDGDALGGVRETLKFLQAGIKSGSQAPDFVLLRTLTAADRAAPEYASVLEHAIVVRKRPALTVENFGRALGRAVAAGRITPEQAAMASQRVASSPFSDWAPAIAHVNLTEAPAQLRHVDYQTAPKVALHHGATGGESVAAPMDSEEVRRTISHLMNTGLQGRKLQSAVLRRYARSDLAQVPSVGARLAKDDGVQGQYFIDPTAYRDYGRGCQTASDNFRKLNSVPNVLASSGCTGCRLQTHPGWCSKLAKTLIRQVPEEVRTKAAERRRLPVVQASAPVRNPVAEFELTSELPVEVAAPRVAKGEISLSGQSVTD